MIYQRIFNMVPTFSPTTQEHQEILEIETQMIQPALATKATSSKEERGIALICGVLMITLIGCFFLMPGDFQCDLSNECFRIFGPASH